MGSIPARGAIMKSSTIDFLFEAAALKRLKRTGWQILGGGNTESVAEHSFMVAVIAYVMAAGSNLNLEKILNSYLGFLLCKSFQLERNT